MVQCPSKSVTGLGVGFHQPFPRWRTFAQARFELIPDYFDRTFIWGENVRVASCSLDGEGYVHFMRPLHSPMLRAYMKESFSPVKLLEVTRYEARFRAIRWKMEGNKIEEFIFEQHLQA